MQSVTEGLEVSDMIKRILSGCLVIGIVAAMIGFQFIFPYSLNIIMALITATAVFELVSAVGTAQISHVSIAKCRVCACNSANTQSNVLVHGYIFPVYHFHAGFYHISLQKGQVSGYLCGIRHDIVGYNLH